MLGQQEAICICPPHGAGTGHPQAPGSFAFTTVASAEQQALPGVGIPISGCFITWFSTSDVRIRFGRQGLVGSAASGDIILPAGQFVNWRHNQIEDAYYSVQGVTASGTLLHWKSNL